jgi:hypothetical protein
VDQKLLVNKLFFFEKKVICGWRGRADDGQWEVGGKMRGWYFSFSNVTIKDLQGLILANNHETINDPFRVRIFLVFENRDIDKR